MLLRSLKFKNKTVIYRQLSFIIIIDISLEILCIEWPKSYSIQIFKQNIFKQNF